MHPASNLWQLSLYSYTNIILVTQREKNMKDTLDAHI